MKYFYILTLLVVFLSCNKDEKIKLITNPNEYNKYLIDNNNQTFERARSEKEFWSKRLRPDSSGVGDLGPLAKAYTAMYEASGGISYLKSAEKIYRKALNISANHKDLFVRGLANNLMAQRRFKEATIILEKSFKGKSNKRATQFLLFDVNMELGNYLEADKLLGLLKNTNDYNYLLRLSKWMDYKGNTAAAIRNLKKAMKIADSRKSKILQIWTYTQLAELYFNSERVEEAYLLYLKVLKLQPDHSIAKKQIAWILFSFEKNTTESIRIINSIMHINRFPDLLLFKAKIADYQENTSESNQLKNAFIETVTNKEYGNMYNKELIDLYSESDPERALQVAKEELTVCSTPDSYALFAYAQFKNGQKEKALQLIEEKVKGKTHNSNTLYYQDLIFNANEK